MVREQCRACASRRMRPMLSLGEQPLANALTDSPFPSEERRYPLDLVFCEECGLAQLTLSVPPSEMFSDYVYYSSYSSTVMKNARDIAERLVHDRGLTESDLVMEIGSNDGYLLKNYREHGVSVLGVDPAENIARQARELGIPTECAFFGIDVAERLALAGHRPSVIHANNVIAHIPDINGVLAGIGRILRDDGVAVIETPYVRDMVDNLEFDTIYHEHLYYYSVTAISRLLQRNGLRLQHVEHLPIHGGSLRIFAVLDDGGAPSGPTQRYLDEEQALGMDVAVYFENFAQRVDSLRARLRTQLYELRNQGATIAGYGAAAKATVLLNAIGIGRDTVAFIADLSPHKQGRYLPGVGIPIVDPKELHRQQPDYVVLFVWNHADEVLAQQDAYRRQGGRFLIPIPEPHVIDPDEQSQ